MNKIKQFIKKRKLVNDVSYKKLADKFLEKARQNLITMSLLSDMNTNKKARTLLKISKEYDSNEWVVICGYYAMYTSASALLAKIGFKSKSHAITLFAIEEFFVKKKLLDKSSFSLLKDAMLKKEEIEKLSEAKHKREVAQYSITKHTTKRIAEQIKKDSYEFVDRMEEVMRELE